MGAKIGVVSREWRDLLDDLKSGKSPENQIRISPNPKHALAYLTLFNLDVVITDRSFLANETSPNGQGYDRRSDEFAAVLKSMMPDCLVGNLYRAATAATPDTDFGVRNSGLVEMITSPILGDVLNIVKQTGSLQPLKDAFPGIELYANFTGRGRASMPIQEPAYRA